MMSVLVFIAGLSTAVTASASAVTLKGVARDTTGHGIADAVVIVRSASTGNDVARARTDASGTYSVGLPSGEFYITISSPGFITATVRDVFVNEAGWSLPPVMLETGNGCGSTLVPQFLRVLQDVNDAGRITGTVLDHSKNAPIANVVITVRCEQSSSCGQATSDGNGHYTFVLKAGESSLHFRHADYFENEYAAYHTQIGYETVNYPVFLDACKRGKCQPRRKPVSHCE